MQCITCGTTIRHIDKDHRHHWDHFQCAKCHYLGMRSGSGKRTKYHGDPLLKTRSTGKSIPSERVKVTPDNVDLYCKLSLILRNKVANPNIVLERNKRFK